MDPYIPLLAALAGALIGAAASVAAIVVQAHYQNKREMTKEAIALAMEDWKVRFALAKEHGGTALPMAAFIHYHLGLIRLAERGNITPAAMKKLSEDQDELIQALAEVSRERRSNQVPSNRDA